jgi:hypothetical protein
MPVIIHNEPQCGHMPTAKRMLVMAWLIDNIGPKISDEIVTEKVSHGGNFLRCIAEYLHHRGTRNLWEHYGRIRTLVRINGTGWTCFSGMGSLLGSGGTVQVYDYIFHIEDESMALQFKLTCL